MDVQEWQAAELDDISHFHQGMPGESGDGKIRDGIGMLPQDGE